MSGPARQWIKGSLALPAEGDAGPVIEGARIVEPAPAGGAPVAAAAASDASRLRFAAAGDPLAAFVPCAAHRRTLI